MTIAILGASGAVGSAAARRFDRQPVREPAGGVPLRLGARNPARLPALDGERFQVDLDDPDRLAAFCAGARIVINCAGPSSRVGDTVARAAAEAGAHYVDVSGEESLRREVANSYPDDGELTALLGAGLLPGLSGLLPRWLARGAPRRLVVHAGGLDRFTPVAAEEYAASLDDGFGAALAAWRDGRVVQRALQPQRDVELPFFSGRVTAHPYLSAEAERVAVDLGISDGEWWNVFDGEHVLAALARVRHDGPDALVRAAALDLAGRRPYQVLVARLDERDTAVLRTSDGYALSGAVAALAARAIDSGEIAPGAYFAAEALDPEATFEALRDDEAVLALETFVSDEETVEEGVL